MINTVLNLKFRLMKTLITSLFILLASTIFSQSDGLIHYQVVTKTKVISVRVSVDEGQSFCSNEIGEIECIEDSVIMLELNPKLNYSLLVNNTDLIRISSEDVIAQAKEKAAPIAFNRPASPVSNNETGYVWSHEEENTLNTELGMSSLSIKDKP